MVGVAVVLSVLLVVVLARALFVRGVGITLTGHTPWENHPRVKVEDQATAKLDRAYKPGCLILGISRGEWQLSRPDISTVIVGTPGSGKTRSLIIPNVIWWDGPTVVTSTKWDVLEACGRARMSKHRGTVWVFDPSGIVPEFEGVRRLYWSPLRGCRDWDTAQRRAADLASVASKGTENPDHWRNRGIQLLGTLLHAAALENYPMSRVIEWVTTGMDWIGQDGVKSPPATILNRHASKQAMNVLETVAADAHRAGLMLRGVLATPDKEQGSIWSAIQGALAPFNNTTVQSFVDAAEQCEWDPATFLNSRDSVFIVAASDAHLSLTPVVVGFIEEIRATVNEISTRSESHRLPLPLLLALDEVANISPLAQLPQVLAEARSRGVTTIAVFQDLSQGTPIWGQDFTDGILTRVGVKIVLPGIADFTTLTTLETLCGNEDVPTVSRSESRSRGGNGRPQVSTSIQTSLQRVPRMPTEKIRTLAMGKALVIAQEAKHVVVDVPDYSTTAPFKYWEPLRRISDAPAYRVREELPEPAVSPLHVVDGGSGENSEVAG